VGEGSDAWKWRRRLIVWEEEQVQECCEILTNIVLQPNLSDRWVFDINMLPTNKK